MAFLEERISVDIQMGFSYEDDYSVQITQTAGGNEYRRLVYPVPKRIFTVRFIGSSPTIYTNVVNLYHRVYGRFAGFRAKVLDDFSTNANTGTPTHLDQTLVKLTSTTWQMVKAYGIGATGLGIGYPVRTIFKPVSGTFKLGINGVLQSTGYTMDYTTGIVIIPAAPTTAVTGGCEFDIPVRFDTAVTIKQDAGWRDTSDIRLMELLNP